MHPRSFWPVLALASVPLLTACGRMNLDDARQTLMAREGQTFETRCRLADDGRNCQDTSNNPGVVVPLLAPASYGLLQQLRNLASSQFQMEALAGGGEPTVSTLNALARQVTIVSERSEPAADGTHTLVYLWTYNAPR